MIDTKPLKVSAGRAPFDARHHFDSAGFTACPFHAGESPKSMHLEQKEDGVWLATCFSTCAKSFDALDFVMGLDKVGFKEALEHIQPKAGTPIPPPPPPKKKAVPLTQEMWSKWGREITEADVARFAKGRPHSASPSFEWFREHCRVKGDYIGCPYWLTQDGNTTCFLLKMRHMDTKDFITEHNVSFAGLSNLDAVNMLEDVYVVEGDIGDVGVLEDAGFVAVSVVTGKQDRFEPTAIKQLCEAPRIFIVGDQANSGDEDPGQGCMDRLQKLLPEVKTYRIRFDEAKDVGELAKKTGDGFASQLESLRDASLIPPTPWILSHIKPMHKLPKRPKMWVADRVFPWGCLSLMSGRQGSMKSYLALRFGQDVAGGHESFLGRTIGKPMNLAPGLTFNPIRPLVVYLDKENPKEEIDERYERLGIVGNSDLIYWGDWSDDPVPDDPLDPRLLELSKHRHVFFIFDSLQDWLGDTNENATGEMIALMNKFKRLARLSAGVLLLHHDNKEDRKTGKSQTRGSTVIVAASDMALKVAKNRENENLLEIRPDRFRMCARWEMDVQVTFGKYYNFDVVRDDDMSESIRKQKLADEEAQEAKRKKKFDSEAPERHQLVELVKAEPSLTATQIERKELGLSRTRIVRILGEAGYTWSVTEGCWVGAPEPTAPDVNTLRF